MRKSERQKGRMKKERGKKIMRCETKARVILSKGYKEKKKGIPG